MCKRGRLFFDFCKTEAWFKESTRPFLIPLCIVLELSDQALAIAAITIKYLKAEIVSICKPLS